MLDIIFTYACLASGIVANKFLLQAIAPDLFIGIRMFIAGLLLLPVSLKNSPRFRWTHLKSDICLILFITICTTLIPAITKAFALKNMLASKTALLGSIDPFVTAFYAYILWGETLSIKKIIGILLGLCGVVIASVATSPTELQWGEILFVSYPEFAALMSVIVSRYGWTLVQLLLKRNRYTPVEMNCMTMVLSGGIALFIAFTRGSALPAITVATPWFIFIFVYTIVVGNMVGYNLYSNCLKKHSATWMSLAGFLVPIFVFLFSQMIGRETLNFNFVAAAAVLFVGLCVFYYDDLAHQKKI